jgi:hypothetical protein
MTREQLAAFARAHRGELAAGGAGAVGLYAYWRRRHGSTAAPADPNADPSGLNAATNPVDPTAFSSAPYDTYDSLQAQLQSLYDRVNALGGDGSTEPDPVPASTVSGIATHGGTNLGRSQLGYVTAPRSPVLRVPVTIPHSGGAPGSVIPHR